MSHYIIIGNKRNKIFMIGAQISRSPLKNALTLAASAAEAQKQRMFVVTQNIANFHVKPSKPGEIPYQRKTIFFKSLLAPKTGAHSLVVQKIGVDPTPFERVYNPTSPACDEGGFVLETNVKPIAEMIDLKEATLYHEASLRSFEKILSMIQNTLSLLKSG